MIGILLVGAGGFVGSIARYAMIRAVAALAGGAAFPYGTLIVNVIGCFVIGLLAQWSAARGVFSDEARLFVFVGILGGFTTFSTFGNETVNLFRGGAGAAAFVNVAAHVVIGLGAVWAGRALGAWVWRG